VCFEGLMTNNLRSKHFERVLQSISFKKAVRMIF
jgi:hypothetical protein